MVGVYETISATVSYLSDEDLKPFFHGKPLILLDEKDKREVFKKEDDIKYRLLYYASLKLYNLGFKVPEDVQKVIEKRYSFTYALDRPFYKYKILIDILPYVEIPAKDLLTVILHAYWTACYSRKEYIKYVATQCRRYLRKISRSCEDPQTKILALYFLGRFNIILNKKYVARKIYRVLYKKLNPPKGKRDRVLMKFIKKYAKVYR